MGVAQRPWTTGELLDLRRHAHLGAAGVAELLERPVHSVRNQAYRLRISLRRDGTTQGLVLGQPRGVSFAGNAAARALQLRELRRASLAGEIDLARIERRAALIARGAPLCPGCTKRPVEKRTTGLCLDCHLGQLAEGHRLEASLRERVREVDREKQAKARARRGRHAGG